MRRLRKAKGWSQVALGRRIGLSQERISAIETHPEKCSIDQLLTILMALEAELRVEQRNSPSAEVPVKSTASGTPTTQPREPW
jgi:HTH-type transcriptional regulator/antitoxin HipB